MVLPSELFPFQYIHFPLVLVRQLTTKAKFVTMKIRSIALIIVSCYASVGLYSQSELEDSISVTIQREYLKLIAEDDSDIGRSYTENIASVFEPAYNPFNGLGKAIARETDVLSTDSLYIIYYRNSIEKDVYIYLGRLRDGRVRMYTFDGYEKKLLPFGSRSVDERYMNYFFSAASLPYDGVNDAYFAAICAAGRVVSVQTARNFYFSTFAYFVLPYMSLMKDLSNCDS